LPDNGIPYVSANNRVLYNRPEWEFYMAYVNEQPAAAAVMHMKDGIASLTFAATLPEYRRLGLHRRLLERRIADAKRNGCTLVVSQCAFLSQSHRNMERIGMKIGFLKTLWTGYGQDPDDGRYWLITFMIDGQHQGKGYGKQAITAFLEYFRANHDADRLVLGHRPDNAAAAALYTKAGFRETGEIIGGEVIRCYTFAE